MAAIGTTEAATALANHFGARLESGRDEGRNLMVDALHRQFGIATREARRLFEVLEHAGTIRWIEQRTDTQARVSASGSMPVASAIHTEGYWQLEPT